MKANGRIGISGVDTRALTRLIRINGAPPMPSLRTFASGKFDIPAARAGKGLGRA
jgi:carbamoyl-phosphate synthase small subunit